ncbi:MAG: hypothetical protein P9L91_04190 [Candidatus Zophobacter franzmannii]|nr:hypothetical protein [Candidatus Zophobacter franzmannii]
MFAALADKVVKGVMSLSFLIFSAYEGNNAVFREPFVEIQNGFVSCQTELVNAFDNDFDDIFKSGEEIVLDYTAEVSCDGGRKQSYIRTHKAKYFPMQKHYMFTTNSDGNAQYFDTLDGLIAVFSKYDRLIPLPEGKKCTIKIISSLNKLYFSSQQREFDLNLLWKNKLPELDINIDIVDVQ